MPVQSMVHCAVGFVRGQSFDEEQLRQLIEAHGFVIDEFSVELDGASRTLEYELILRSTTHARGIRGLEHALLAEPMVSSFRLMPARD